MKILVTGTAGFIGFHLTRRLADAGHEVLGLDNVNDYYDVRLKHARLERLGLVGWEGGGRVTSRVFEGLSFVLADVRDQEGFRGAVEAFGPDVVCHLAAQAGVRHSLTHPHDYVDNNVTGFLNVLEACRYSGVGHLVYASSSSVYGANREVPFSEGQNVDRAVSMYAATKKANELMAHAYSHLYGLPTTGLRFFTVYGPWGRPDMALFKFVRAILAGEPIEVYNHGDMERDFTYVDDIVEGLVRIVEAGWSPGGGEVPYRIYNIGNGHPVKLMDFILAIEERLGLVADKELLPMQPGDVVRTWADTAALERDFGYRPSTPVAEGIDRFVGWYLGFYGRGGRRRG